MPGDFLDEMIAKRTARDPEFPQKLDGAKRKRVTDRHLAEDPEFAAEYERQSA